MKSDKKFPKVIIIGGGFGGIQLAKKLRHAEVNILMLDRHNYHTFQPLLYQVATGGLEPDSIAFPIRKVFREQKNLAFRVANVTAIHTENNTISTSIGDFDYDYLVLATGSETNFFGQKEIEHYAMPMKTVPEALNLRSLILQNLEEALIEEDPIRRDALLNFVVVGGGPTGVETAGALAELKNHVLPADYPELDIQRMRIFLIENSERVLTPFSEQASYKAQEFLENMGVTVMLQKLVAAYDGDRVVLKDGEILPTKAVIWSAGVKGATIPGLDKAQIVRGGRIKTQPDNLIVGYNNIFAIGDLAAIESPEYPYGHPGVAQVAIQQGQQLAKNLVRIINNQPTQAFDYYDKGSMATIGRNKAVVDLKYWKFQGFFAWLTWMFIHLLFLVGFRNKMVTLMNWIVNYFSYDRGTRLIIRKFDRDLMKEEAEAI
ncbi:NAD(P)/FAD-dependent oxidoreductase [Pedobacter puniceum]|jgi:NADH dehydrogenase|uniref:NADH:ubiquinone reductase (non-electrogenic) n=1 Tax=Pedobacter puniceum TaxID=2666136 RepID=A0A7K0FJE5_9SPHI|nr:NAD(P)/FAD-dependent oxidoreductase [Pedobacter puniceum]MRX46094.1 NAD(P)/FAD-dependent oxidoreductase [Pedobacter puniceum]